MEQKRAFFTIVLGAGASGLACAGVAQKGGEVLLLDHGQKSACKVDISGGGKANFTNANISVHDFHTNNPRFCSSALSRFTPQDCLTLLDSCGVCYEEREYGQFFCSRSAKDFSRVLRLACTNCSILLETTIRNVEKADNTFMVHTNRGIFSAQNLVVALGSPAFPQAGATSLGTHLAKQFGHALHPFRPALVGFSTAEWGNGELAGLSLPVHIHTHVPKKHPYTITDVSAPLPLLFTHTGISGPAVLQASLVWEEGFPLTINFLPRLDLEEFLQSVKNGKLLLLTLLKQHLPERFAHWLLHSLEIPNVRLAELPKTYRQRLSRAVNSYTITPDRTEGFKKAEVAKGGVDTAHVSSKTFESTLVEGLYFCGEVLDITGRLGGYNLHWALASGKAVGEALVNKAISRLEIH